MARNGLPRKYEKQRIYLSDGDVDRLSSHGHLSPAARAALQRYWAVIDAARPEVLAVLDGDELAFLEGAVRRYQSKVSPDADPDLLLLAVGAAPAGLDAKYCVRASEVDTALRGLSLPGKCCLLDAIERSIATWDRGVKTSVEAELQR